MKRLICFVLIALMCVGAYMVAFGSNEPGKEDYKAAVSKAEDLENRGLYELAIREYETAASIQNSTEVQEKALSIWEKWYEEDPSVLNEYTTAAKNAVSLYGDNAEFRLVLAENFIRGQRWQEAYEELKHLVDAGGADDETIEKYRKVRYAVETDWKSYSEYRPLSGDMYAVCRSDAWRYIKRDGADTDEEEAVFASRVGENGIHIVSDGGRTLIKDSEGTIQGKLSFVPEDAGCYADGLLPIKHDGTWGFYNSLGDYLFGEYTEISNYCNGVAAVSDEEGIWYFVDTNGERISDKTYQDVVLAADGSWVKGGRYVLKNADGYQLYSTENGLICDMNCENVDVITEDGNIAFSRDGLWGYLDKEGKEIIEPQYPAAKSFSSGLAAVSNGELWGFIELNGELAIDYQYYDADYFNEDDTCMVKTTTASWQLIKRVVHES